MSRPWLKVAAVAYQSSMTSAQIAQAAARFDLLDGLHEEFAVPFKALSNAPILRYVVLCTAYTTDSWWWGAMQSYAQAHGGNVEDLMLHWTTGKKVEMAVGGYTGDRYFTNPKSPLYIAWLKEWLPSIMPEGSVSYNGVWADDCHDKVLIRNLVGDGTIREYPNSTYAADYDRDLLALYDQVRAVFAPKGLTLSVNVAEYDYPAIAAHVDSVWRETLIVAGDIGNRWGRFDRCEAANAAGAANIVAFADCGTEKQKIEALAAFYIRCDPARDYFWDQGTYSDLSTQWFEALGSTNGDVGVPTGGYTESGNVYQRAYSQALVLLNLGATQRVTLPTGIYRPLGATGTLGPTVSGSVNLGNEEGAILMRTGTTPPPPPPPPPPAPVASFTATPTTGVAPLAVAFTDTSTGTPTGWAWTFGDGATSVNIPNPTHTYSAAGAYTVTLTVTNAGGSASVTKAAHIVVTETPPPPPPTPTRPVASFTHSPTSGPAPLTVKFTDTSTGAPTGWWWFFGDGTTSTDQNPTHVFTTPGAFWVTFAASNAAGSSGPVGVVKVTPPSAPLPILSGVTVNTPSIPLGRGIEIHATLTNGGATAAAGGLVVSFLSLTADGDRAAVRFRSNWGTPLVVMENGRIAADESVMPWEAGRAWPLSVIVTPRERGQFVIEVHGWLTDASDVTVKTETQTLTVTVR